MYTLTINVGFIWVKSIRILLDKIKAEHADFSYIEGPGIIERTFVLKGPIELLKMIIKSFPE